MRVAFFALVYLHVLSCVVAAYGPLYVLSCVVAAYGSVAAPAAKMLVIAATVAASQTKKSK